MTKDGNIVCDFTGTILEDKVSLYPGYIEVRDGFVYRVDNDGSKTKEYHPGVPKQGIQVEKLFKFDKKLNGKHFIDLNSLYHYYRTLDK
jgi:hypothetical protein